MKSNQLLKNVLLRGFVSVYRKNLILLFIVQLIIFAIIPSQTLISKPIPGKASAIPNPVCSGSNTTLILSGYTGTIQWYFSANNSTFTIIAGATSASYTTGVLTSTTYYYAIVTQGIGAGSTSTSNTTTVTVEPLPTVSVTPKSASICSGTSVSLTSTIGYQCGSILDLSPGLQNGLVAYYPFCGNANDVSGNGNNGLVEGASLTADRFGNPNEAYSFNGINNLIHLPNTINFINSFTICFWIQTSSSDGSSWPYGAAIIDRDICGTALDWSIGFGNGGEIQFNTGTSSQDLTLTSTININDNTWHFIVVNLDTILQTKNIYINGILNNSTSWTTETFLNNYLPVHIGATVCDSNSHTYFNGKVDDVMFYNRALLVTEVQQLYNLNSGKHTVWSTGDTTQNITVTPDQTTTYIMTGKIGEGCSNSDSCVITVGATINPNNVYVTQARQKGNDTTLLLSPTGKGPFTYQWFYNNTLISGATNNNYNLTPITCTDSGIYTCSIKNNCDSINAKVVKLYVTNCSRFRHALTGYVKYDNADSTVMTKTNVYLANSGDTIISSATTDVKGYYVFVNIINGKYNLSCSTTKAWGGVSPVDALIVNRTYIGMYTLTDPIKIKAEDVNNDGKINPTDALMINRRYIGVINNYKTNNWLFSDPVVNMNGLDISKNIIALCAGDINASYIPPQRITNYQLLITNEKRIEVDINKPFAIPVYLNDNVELGAIGIKLLITNDKLRIIGVKSDLAGLIYNITEEGVNIAWSAEKEGYLTSPEKPLFFIQCIMTDESKSDIDLLNRNFQITSESVLADIDANLISIDKLVMPEIEVRNQKSEVSFSCYPNPFNNFTNINYSIAEDANVELNLYNVLGESIVCLTNEKQQAGNHNLQFDGSNLNEGIYYCRLNVSNVNFTYSKTNILIISR